MREDNNTQQTAQEIRNTAEPGQEGQIFDVSSNVDRTASEFNRYLFENVMSNVEEQIRYWDRKAECQVDPQVEQALRLKAEGLGYALRLLNAFEPEFRELVDCASRSATDGTIDP